MSGLYDNIRKLDESSINQNGQKQKSQIHYCISNVFLF